MQYIDFLDLCEKRYSCRNYSTEPVNEEKVMKVLRTAQLAPSACNRQPWTFYVVTDAGRRQRMLTKSRPAFNDAPVLIVAIGHHDQAWHRTADNKDHTDIDLAIAGEHIALAAEAAGLATCWICSFDVDAVRAELNLAENEEPVALFPLGYAAEDDIVPKKSRKPLTEIVKWVD